MNNYHTNIKKCMLYALEKSAHFYFFVIKIQAKLKKYSLNNFPRVHRTKMSYFVFGNMPKSVPKVKDTTPCMK